MNPLHQAALLDAIKGAHSAPRSVEGSPADENEELCCPKCHYCGPEQEFKYDDQKDEKLESSGREVAGLRVGSEDQDA